MSEIPSMLCHSSAYITSSSAIPLLFSSITIYTFDSLEKLRVWLIIQRLSIAIRLSRTIHEGLHLLNGWAPMVKEALEYLEIWFKSEGKRLMVDQGELLLKAILTIVIFFLTTSIINQVMNPGHQEAEEKDQKASLSSTSIRLNPPEVQLFSNNSPTHPTHDRRRTQSHNHIHIHNPNHNDNHEQKSDHVHEEQDQEGPPTSHRARPDNGSNTRAVSHTEVDDRLRSYPILPDTSSSPQPAPPSNALQPAEAARSDVHETNSLQVERISASDLQTLRRRPDMILARNIIPKYSLWPVYYLDALEQSIFNGKIRLSKKQVKSDLNKGDLTLVNNGKSMADWEGVSWE